MGYKIWNPIKTAKMHKSLVKHICIRGEGVLGGGQDVISSRGMVKQEGTKV